MPEIVVPRPWLRVEARRGGWSDAELAASVRRGDVVRLQRGAYLDSTPADRVHRHAARVVATAAGLTVPGLVSHQSAAVLHGLPVWLLDLRRVHVLRRPPTAGSGSSRVHLHVARHEDDETATAHGVTVTDATRTVIDVARTCSFDSAVVVADAALRRKQTSPAALAARLARMGPVPGTRRAARVVAFADGRSESVGESRSRLLFQRLALPAPDLQVEVWRADGSLIGRTDFGWEEHSTVGEFDGKVKYGRLLRPGQTAGDVVWEEKRREDELRETHEVVRWTWGELDRPTLVQQRLLRAFERGRRR